MPEFAPEEIDKALSRWDISEISHQDVEGKAKTKLAMSNWLYDLAKRNVKRGRFFQLRDVLLYQQADCLGYAKLMNRLGQRFDLDIGIVEVVIDNGGRYVPHYVNFVKLPPDKRKFIDLWYGSEDIKHRRIGAQIREGNSWRIKDLDWDELEEVEDLKGLPHKAIEGITYYILGNRHLQRGIQDKNREELDYAIAHYTRAIGLYPGYARAHFNRAIAYENKGEYERAAWDYTQALRDETSQLRVLAREHEDVVSLMQLDKANIGIGEQEIYLLWKGFGAGREVTSANVAKYFRIPEDEVKRILSAIETKLNR